MVYNFFAGASSAQFEIIIDSHRWWSVIRDSDTSKEGERETGPERHYSHQTSGSWDVSTSELRTFQNPSSV